MIGVGFFLCEATAGERTTRDRLTFEAWGACLTREQYLDRERLLRQTAHGQRDMHTWVLRLSGGVIVASCETFRLPLMPHGAVEVIATVYVERGLRGVNMASRMMEALVQARREAGIDGLLLFSEVGTGIYARAGFRQLPAPTRSWAASAREQADEVEHLTRADLTAALAERERWRDGRIDVRLTEAIVDWHLERSAFYARMLGRAPPIRVGARAGGVQLLWAPDFKSGALRILDAAGAPGASLAPVAAAAAAEAVRLGLSSVELWDDGVTQQLEGGLVRDRQEDLPMGQAFTPVGELFLGAVGRACWA